MTSGNDLLQPQNGSAKTMNSTTPIRILHVDDDTSVLEISKQILMDMDDSFEFDAACCVDEAFKKLSTGNYDVVISDYEMPKKNGLHFLKELRQKDGFPFILFTGKGREEVAIQALNLGANGYINKQGSPETVYGELAHAIRTTVEANRAKIAVKESEFKFVTISNFSPDWVYWMNPDGSFVYVSPACEKITGYTPEEFFKDPNLIHDIIYPQDRELVNAHFNHFNESKEYSAEFRILTKTGQVHWILHTCNQVTDDKGKWLGRRASNRDITERKKDEDKLRKSSQTIDNIINSTNNGVYALDRNWNFVYINERMAKIVGSTPDKMIGRNGWSFFSKLVGTIVEKNLREVMEKRKSRKFEWSGLYSNEKWEIHVFPTEDGISVFADDITERKKAEEILDGAREQVEFERKRLETILETTPSAVAIIDAQSGKFSYVNKRAMQLYGFDTLGLSLDENVAKVKAKRADGTDYPIEEMPVNRSLKLGQEARNEEMIIERANGQVIPIIASTAPLRDMKGNITAAIAVFEDITERKKAEDKLKESEDRYSKLSSAAFEGIAITRESKILDANLQFAKMLGYESSEIVGMSVSDLVAPESRELVRTNMQKGYEGPYEHLALKKDGSVFPVEVRAKPIQYKKQLARVTAIRDITERKKVEKAIRVKDFALASANIGIAFADLAGNVTYVNNQALKIWGYGTEEEVLGRPVTDFFLLSSDKSKEIARALSDEAGWIGDLTAKRKNGQQLTIQVSGSIVRDETGKPLCRIGSFLDATERKKAEEARLLSEARFRLLYENSLEGILLAMADGKILSANNAACKMFGVSEEEIKKATRKELVVDAQRLKPAIKERERTGKTTVELTFRRKDGSIFEGEVTSTAFKDIDGSTKTNMIIRDITGRKEKEKEERAKADEIREVINCIGDLLFVIDKNHVIIKVNKTTCDTFKKSAEELIGRHCYEIVHGTDKPYPECPAVKTLRTKQLVTDEINDPNVGIPLLVTTSPILDEQGEVVQVIHVAKDISKIKIAEMEMQVAANLFDAASDSILVHDLEGRIVYFNEACYKTRGYNRDEFQALKISDLEAPGDNLGVDSRIKLVLEKGEAVFEVMNLCKDKSVVLLEVHSRVIESDGRKMILSVARDISERKKAEETLKENSARIEAMNEKLRVVGGLTRHDVRNKLSAVNGYAYLLKKKYAHQPDIVEGLGKIELAVADSVKIFEFAKMYEQLGVEKLTYVDVGMAVDEALALFSGLTLKVVNDCHGRSVLADSFLRQMFYNFIDNTRRYGEKATTAKMYFGQEDSGGLRLIYEDDGVGISAENKPQLFNEGFSTGGSTGFGLFFIKKMMDVYGWTITEEGEPGKGAKFIITIPM